MIIVLEIGVVEICIYKKKMSVFENLAIVKGLRKRNKELQKG